ncbi:hypothetical protein MMC25_006149 [Agyrium rufum]|nr:hypothetical protein [Agyrium rufum]
MAALHDSLKALCAISYTDIPINDHPSLESYLKSIFSSTQLLLESVPPPPSTPTSDTTPSSSLLQSATPPTGRPRASTASSIIPSPARSAAPIPEHAALQREWGKPIKLSTKENPLNIAVYKASGKDGKGAWFARRSVHEGLGFRRWKEALKREFPESLKVQGGPGEGNIRGIGGERVVERKEVQGVGVMEVYHLSAQFPGPTTPRDFVELLLTSEDALDPRLVSSRPDPSTTTSAAAPRHFMVISKPCTHPDCPPRDGFIRGQYESVEFIREVPLKPRRASSVSDLRKLQEQSMSLGRTAMLKNASKLQSGMGVPQVSITAAEESSMSTGGDSRTRGKTISFAESRGKSAKGEALDLKDGDDEEEINPVEWIMITRSDPGGSVPRFMVERGTPSGIVGDASKFLDWACKIATEDGHEAITTEEGDEKRDLDGAQDEDGVVSSSIAPAKVHKGSMDALHTNGHIVSFNDPTNASTATMDTGVKEEAPKENQGSMFSYFTSAAYSSVSNYAPQSIVNRINGTPSPPTDPPAVPPLDTQRSVTEPTNSAPTSPLSSSTSIASFLSAESDFSKPSSSTLDASSHTALESSDPNNNPTDPTTGEPVSPTRTANKELQKLQERKAKLDAKFKKTLERGSKNQEDLTSRETERIRKAEEKHAQATKRAEEKHAKELASLQAKREKETRKEEARRKKVVDRDERSRLERERKEALAKVEVRDAEVELLSAQVRDLQRENTALVVRLGKMEGGKDVLARVRSEIFGTGTGSGGGSGSSTALAVGDAKGGGRSRSASMRSKESGGSGTGTGTGSGIGHGEKSADSLKAV